MRNALAQKIRSDKITVHQIFKNKDDSRTTGYWHYYFRFENKTVRKSSRTKDFSKACEIAEDHYNDLKHRAKYGMPTSEKTFKQVYDEWWKLIGSTLSKNRVKSFTSFSTNYFIPFFGKSKIVLIDTNEISKFITWRMKNSVSGKPLSGASLKNEMQHLIQFLTWVVESKHLDQIPKVNIPSSINTKRGKSVAFSDEDIITITNKARGFYIDGATPFKRKRRAVFISYFMFLIYSGMRTNEAAHLKWKHVKITKDEVTAYLADTRIEGGSAENFKTGGRTIVILPESRQWLELRKREMPEYIGKEDYIFPTDKNEVSKTFSYMFDTFMKYSGTVKSIDDKKYTMYCTRHTYITNRLMQNVSSAIVAQNTGTSLAMIDQTYGHIKVENARSQLNKGSRTDSEIEQGVADILAQYADKPVNHSI